MKFRQGLNLNRENFSDTPDFYWGEPELEGMTELIMIRTDTDVNQIPLKGFFNSLSDALEVKARTTSVNEKITYAAEVRILRLCIIEF